MASIAPGVGRRTTRTRRLCYRPSLPVLTIYITDLPAYLNNRKSLGEAYREVFGKHFPAITLVEVASLSNADCMVEISGIAVID